MTTVKKMFSYDDEFDRDVHDFLKSLPAKKQSSCIRQALRLYMQFQASGQPMMISPFGIQQQMNIEEPSKKEDKENDIYTEEIDDDFLNGFELMSEEDFKKLDE